MKHLKYILSAVFLFWALSYLQAQVAQFSLSPREACDSLTVTFTNLSINPLAKTPTFTWTFGDGSPTSNSASTVSHQYKTAGKFYVRLEMKLLNDPNVYEFKDSVSVRPHPNAFFFVTDTFALGSLAYCFRSGKAPVDTIDYRYMWTLNPQNPIYTKTDKPGNDGIHDTLIYGFSQEGVYTMKLKTDDNFGCVDSFVQDFRVTAKLRVPNVFTPNGDGKNDNFTVFTSGRTIFSLKIFTLNGQLIFQSESRTISWDGKTSSGDLAWPGTYFYIIKATGGDPVKQETGFLLLLRNK
jgi:gliding motility-associated-like protein